MQKKVEVGILGATGMVGQHFVKFLQGHPWFEITWLGASDRSAGKPYAEATSWRLDGVMPENVARLVVQDSKTVNGAPRLLFSAMDASVATEIERAFAQAGHVVVSNSRNHRMEPDVPLLVPEINPDHLNLIPIQQRKRGWKGQIATNPNCSTVVLTMALAPLQKFGIEKVIVTTMQAISGAGYPGVASMDINANVIPFIGGEEEKMEQETQKILGTLKGDQIAPLEATVSAHCNRVPVVDGHTITVSVGLREKPSEADILEALDKFRPIPQQRGLPSAPRKPVVYMEENNRPQPRRDVERERGMAVFVGRLRRCPVLDFKFVALGHNTVRGAAGAAVLNAELMYSEGLLD
ncbi:MAG: aspartate-semialdehyde dehydrogenase [Bryobacteraceae bacterium]|jgi:aspartate-semialdehyde dehydrogenase (non-peptidoglycan organisms)|nr:aspartate-semialdehyde dehydrogenase [Bryobacteraceae bacterium]